MLLLFDSKRITRGALQAEAAKTTTLPLNYTLSIILTDVDTLCFPLSLVVTPELQQFGRNNFNHATAF